MISHEFSSFFFAADCLFGPPLASCGQELKREQSQKLQVASEKSQDLEAVAIGSWIWKGSMKNNSLGTCLWWL